MSKFIDITGKKYNRLTVINRAENSPAGNIRFNCICDCGKHTKSFGTDLRSGRTKSCGCHARELINKILTKHGMEKSTEYKSWQGAKARCYNVKNKKYHRYGGRGIKVCERWRNSFVNFIFDMGKKPSVKHTLDRIDNDGNYCPENCKWSTGVEQSNNRSTNTFIKYNGEHLTLAQWGKKTGIPANVISSRLRILNWSTHDAITTPIAKCRTLTFNGDTKTISEWANHIGIARKIIESRLSAGWSVDRTLGEIVNKRCHIY